MLPDTTGVGQQITPKKDPELVPGGRLNRFIASILDDVILGLVYLPVILLAQIITLGKISFEETALNQVLKYPLVLTIVLIIYALYRIVLLVRNEATPGKILRKLKIVQSGNGMRINLLRASVREIAQVAYYIPILGTLLFLISAILILFSKKRRALHDLVGGTIVIQQNM